MMELLSGRKLPAFHIRLLGSERVADGLEIWGVTLEELPGCFAQGLTLHQAEATLWRILPRYVAQLRQYRQPIPEPHAAGGVTVEGVSIVMLPGGIQTRPSDPGVTDPGFLDQGELRTGCLRADAGLIGS
jgi:predicted RNase H-like HicB family nuclease